MYIISAVIEKERTAVALLDKEYKLCLKKEGVRADLVTLCSEVISESGINAADVLYAGVAVDGSVGCHSKAASELEKSTGIKCFSASLADAKALGEAYYLNDADTLVLLAVDEEIECGIVIGKKSYAGTYRNGRNVAHTVISFDGFECSCGRRGCFEAYACNSGFNRIVAEAGIDRALTHSELFAMNTPEADYAKKLYVEYLSAGITNIINLFQPRHLVLDGPFTKVGDALMAPMMDIILREQYTHSMPNKCDVRFANTDADTALIGAALLGR